MFDTRKQATDLLTSNHDEATIVCDVCGLMYTARPLVCLCRSSVFLREHRESDIDNPLFNRWKERQNETEIAD